MNRSLVVGCSFVNRIIPYTHSNFDVYGSPAASNASIAARVLYQISQYSYQHVTVLWSGINRLSLPLDAELHEVYRRSLTTFDLYDDQGPTVWYHSGGILGPEWNTNMPSWVKRYFVEQYKTVSPRYLTDHSMSAIASVQAILSARAIPYCMSFIYDIRNSYSAHGCGYSLGQVDTKSTMYNLVDWSRIYQDNNPYDYAIQNRRLEPDLFHPTGDCMIQWIKDHLGVDLRI